MKLQNDPSQNSDVDHTKCRPQPWKKAFLDAVNPKTSGKYIPGFIQREIERFHLSSRVSIHEVLAETYIRGYQFIKKGGVITNPSAWTRATARYIVRELSRNDRKQSLIDDMAQFQDSAQQHQADDPAEWNDQSEDYQKLHVAMQQLSPKEKRLLELKIVQHRSWTDIQQIMKEEGFGDASIVNWRKRKERALGKLKKAL
jgi:DNA-directed RNA polymerase specialized sigma24 family protein